MKQSKPRSNKAEPVSSRVNVLAVHCDRCVWIKRLVVDNDKSFVRKNNRNAHFNCIVSYLPWIYLQIDITFIRTLSVLKMRIRSIYIYIFACFLFWKKSYIPNPIVHAPKRLPELRAVSHPDSQKSFVYLFL